MSWVLGCPDGHVDSILHRKLSPEEKKENDVILFDGAGFIPFDVRIKQMERAGMRLNAVSYDVDIRNLRDSYAIADFEPEEGDTVDDIVNKEIARARYYNDLMKDKLKEKKSVEGSPHEAESLNKEAEKPIVENPKESSSLSE